MATSQRFGPASLWLALVMFAWPMVAASADLGAMGEDKRREVLGKLLRRNGESCPAVTRTFFQGRSGDGAAFWSVECSSGKSWQVMFAGRGGTDARLLDCAVLKMLGGPYCFARFK